MSTSQSGNKTATDAEIGERISNALIVKNSNAKALSAETGIAYNRLRTALKGEKSLTVNEIGKIADAIKVRPAVFLPDSFGRRSAA